MSTSKKKPKRDTDGRKIIHMTVKDDSDFLSPFSAHSDPVISSEVAEFLENSIKPMMPKETLTLQVHSNCIDEAEQIQYRAGIRHYYSDCLALAKKEHRRNTILAWILAAVGIVVIAIALAISAYGLEIWTEAVDIVGWVFLWEAVDILAFKNRGLKIDCLRYSSLADMKIEFDTKTA